MWKNSENWWFWKTHFFELAIWDFFFKKKNCFIPMKISQSFLGSKDGSKFWWLPWFPAKNHPPQTFLACVYMASLRFLHFAIHFVMHYFRIDSVPSSKIGLSAWEFPLTQLNRLWHVRSSLIKTGLFPLGSKSQREKSHIYSFHRLFEQPQGPQGLQGC